MASIPLLDAALVAISSTRIDNTFAIAKETVCVESRFGLATLRRPKKLYGSGYLTDQMSQMWAMLFCVFWSHCTPMRWRVFCR